MRTITFFSLLLLSTSLTGCWPTTSRYEGVKFPKTTTSEIVFQERDIPADCSVFSHTLMNSKMRSSGKDLSDAMHKEAEDKGADLILIGMTREILEKDLTENRFDYYGPEFAYTFSNTWMGWKFGFDQWNDANDLVGLGSGTWGNSDTTFNSSLLIQAVFLRCGQGR